MKPMVPASALLLALFALSASAQDEKPKDAGVQPDGLKNLRHPDPNVRYRAAAVLTEQGPRARFASAELREALKDTDPLVRVKVAEALWVVERPGPSVVLPTLERGLRDKNPEVRGAACAVIGLMGSKGKSAAPALVETLRDKDVSVVLAAIAALGDVGPAAHESAAALLRLSSYADFALLEPLVGASLGSMGDAVVPALTAALKDTSTEQRRVAAYALGSIGPDARSAVPALERLLRDEQAGLRFLAARALGRIGKDAQHALPRLQDATADKDAPVRIRAALAVWQISGATRYVPLLSAGLRDPSLAVRDAAAQALATMGPDAREATAALTQSLQDAEPTLRQAVLTALARIGPDAKAAAPAVAPLLKDSDKLLRPYAAFALWRLTGTAKESLAALTPLLSDEPGVQSAALESLGNMGAAARGVLPQLVTMYREEDRANVRAALGAAIKQIDAELARKLGIR